MDHHIRVIATVNKPHNDSRIEIKTRTVWGTIRIAGELNEQLKDGEEVEVIIRKPQ